MISINIKTNRMKQYFKRLEHRADSSAGTMEFSNHDKNGARPAKPLGQGNLNEE
jgi:hypothetical protein